MIASDTENIPALGSRIKSWLKHALGLDRAIGFTILARLWSGLAGLVTVSLIARCLSPAEQGYYFTFGSLVAVQIIFELGFSFVILQMASHERAHLDISPDHDISGDPIAHARLASVLQKTIRWYCTLAALMACSLIPLGFRFFSSQQHVSDAVGWRTPWVCIAIATAITFQLDALLSFSEGCGYVANIARLRLWQAAIGSTLAWTLLILHHGLFAPAAIVGGNAFGASYWLFRRKKLLIGLLRTDPGENRIVWMSEVWPFQWRMAVSYLCGYFIFQLFNPLLFMFRGPVEAGQMGMSLSLVNALQSVTFSWIATKASPFGNLIARRQFKELDRVFFGAARQSVIISLAGVCALITGCWLVSQHHLRFAHRILPLAPFAILLMSVPFNVAVFAQAYYLRAHKQEKLLLNSVVGAVLVVLSSVVLGRLYGAMGMVTGYLLINFAGFGWVFMVFQKYRRIWHIKPEPDL